MLGSRGFFVSGSRISISGIFRFTFPSGAHFVAFYLIPRYTLSMHNTPNLHGYTFFFYI